MTKPQDMLERAFPALEQAITSGRIPGGVLGIVDRDGNRAIRALGSAQTHPIKRPMTEDTWFDLASISKVAFTTERILALAEAGAIDLDKERARLAKEAAGIESDLEKIARKLGNEQFLAKAKPEVIEEQRDRQAEAEAALARVRAAMARLGAG